MKYNNFLSYPLDIKIQILLNDESLYKWTAIRDVDVYNFTVKYPAIFINNFLKHICDDDGERWGIFGHVHSFNDEPAFITQHGKYWVYKGFPHRVTRDANGQTLPAVILFNGVMQWYNNGILYREDDLPAIESPNTDIWFINGKQGRAHDRPNVILKCDNTVLCEMWTIGFDEFHRNTRDEHGYLNPAIINHYTGAVEYCNHGHRVSCTYKRKKYLFHKRVKKYKAKLIK